MSDSTPLSDQLHQLCEQALAQIAQVEKIDDVYPQKVAFLGKKGRLTDVLKGLKDLPNDQKPQIGQLANQIKTKIQQALDQKTSELAKAELQQKIKATSIDVTLPGTALKAGALHPIYQVIEQIQNYFTSLGFDIALGPDVEDDYHNFEALNFAKDHPARDMQDTFYLNDERLLRTHTSPVQIRYMLSQKPPLRMIAPGAVYRCDSDVTHSPMFHQVEALVVDKNIHMGHLKGLITDLIQELFGARLKMQLRPSFFPFTEPSAEVDMQCFECKGKGCRLCSHTGWIEIMGCGMVDPNVFKSVDIDPNEYSGFAFGIGIERVAMLQYGIHDIRLFYQNDLRFLEQFR